jgi:hypothetical protein
MDVCESIFFYDTLRLIQNSTPLWSRRVTVNMPSLFSISGAEDVFTNVFSMRIVAATDMNGKILPFYS